MLQIMIMVVVFLILLFLGVPVVFSLGISTLPWLLLNSGQPITIVSQNMMNYMLSFTLISMPGFLLVGRLMNSSGVTERLLRFAVAVIGRFRGGLAMANALASMLFASMSGTAVGDAGGLGLVEMTMMRKAGYNDDVAAGITAASSILGPIIPPSTIMVLLGSVASISVSSLFYGGIIPGVLLALAMIGLIFVRAHFTAEGKSWPKTKVSRKEMLRAIPRAIPALMTFVIIIGSINTGVCTATEAAVLAVWWALLLGIVYKELSLKKLWDTLTETVRSAGMFMFIIAVASYFAWIMTVQGLPTIIKDLMAVLINYSAGLVYLVCIIIFLIVGCFLDTGCAVLLLAPILMPVISGLGLSTLHFGLVMITTLMIGIITPPFGICLFVVADVANIPVKDVTKEAVKYIPAMLIIVVLITVFPKLVTWLPGLIG